MRRSLEWVIYPAVIGGALAAFALLTFLDAPLWAAAYLPSALGIAIVLAYERIAPYRREWTASANEAADDLVFLALVQVALPQALALLAALSFANWLDGSGGLAIQIFPSDAPVWAQIATCVLAADFGRYWLHRWAHRTRLLWRLHAVHHAPEKLNGLNVSRFHPVEKALHYAIDAGTLALLGATPEAVAGYFVLYATHGFFQHSNARLRLGPLNWVMAGPELHRWHHAREPHISDHNFGNTVIIWDWLFGTRYAPTAKAVGALGLRDRAYPKRFLGQILQPFRRGGDGVGAP